MTCFPFSILLCFKVFPESVAVSRIGSVFGDFVPAPRSQQPLQAAVMMHDIDQIVYCFVLVKVCFQKHCVTIAVGMEEG